LGTTTGTGFYVFDSSATLLYRHDAFDKDDLGNERLLYGRQILTVPGDDVLVYVNEYGLAEYHVPSRSFRELSQSEEQWELFMPPVFLGWRAVTQISDHEYMFLTRTDSLVYYNHRLATRIASKYPSSYKDRLTWDSRVFMLNDSSFLINGGYQGFYAFQFNRTTGEIQYQEELYLKDFKIRCFFQDQSERLWIGTTKGLLKQKAQPVAHVYDWPVDDVSRFGYSDAYRYKDKLYVSRFSRDVGLVLIDHTTMQKEKEFTFFSKDNPSNEVFNMEMYHPDTLWLGTNAGLIWFDLHSHQYGKVGDVLTDGHSALWAILTPRGADGYAWMCDLLGGNATRYHIPSRQFDTYHLTSNPPIPFLKVRHVCIDAYGDAWLGGHSLTRWSHHTHSFDTLMKDYGGPNRYEDEIKLLRADRDGSLWMHNTGNGLLQYKIQDREWVHYGMNDGLPSDVIHAMSDVRDHTLWLTSQDQLIRFNTETRAVESFNAADGIPDVKPVSANMYVDPTDDQLFVFYHDEVVVLPFEYQQDTTVQSEIVFQQLIVNNAKTFFFPDHALEFGPKENNLILQFTVIDFTDGQQNKFAYRMHDDDDWTSLGNQRTLHLTNLGPGDYTLEIEAAGKTGIKKTRTLSFRIAPPFWSTPVFILICAAVMTTIIYLLYRMRIAQFQEKANLDKLISQTEMKALHAQMNPHFIFNSLNSIREMILNKETQEASHFLGNFAHLIRITLDQSRQSFISLRNTMDYLERYIAMEKIRNTDFHFRMEVDESLDPDETILPPLLIQPFIENAIWHGMNGEDKEIHILVQFKKTDAQLICIIEDDGIGFEQAMKNKHGSPGHESVSIVNIRKRIELLNQKHDLHSNISITDKHNEGNGTGTLVRMTLP
jgi:streptogramin lyase